MILAELLERAGISRRKLAAAAGVGVATLCDWLNRGRRPRNWAVFRGSVGRALAAALPDIPGDDIMAALDAYTVTNSAPAPQTAAGEEDKNMLLSKQRLDQATRKAFNLLRDPLAEPESPEDIFLPPAVSEVRAALYDAAVNGNFLAVVGESGSGKSMLIMELEERLKALGGEVVIIKPHTLSMSAAPGGKMLRAGHIAEAVINSLAPRASIPVSPEMRYRKMHTLLRESREAGRKHCLVIDEAHDLHPMTLKALKRFWELRDGMKRLLSIILLGQTELARLLGNTAADVREVVQRCDVVTLPTLDNIVEYMRFRFRRADLDLSDYFTPDALEAMERRLYVARDKKGQGVFFGYPLAVSNLAIAALNCAAQLGEDKVSAQVIKQIKRNTEGDSHD